MGPEATAEFYRQLIELSPAENDQDHLPVIMLSDPRVPDRTEYILGTGEPFFPYLVDLARALESFGADFIAMPCNTAHLFWQELSDAVSVPFLNIVEETVERIEGTCGDECRQIGILATKGTIKSSLYQRAISGRGLVPLVPSEGAQRRVHEVIKWIKAKVEEEASKAEIESAIRSLQSSGADAVILGCTELGLVDELQVSVPLFDSLKILVRATLREALVDS
jgi:aspartate racemase